MKLKAKIIFCNEGEIQVVSYIAVGMHILRNGQCFVLKNIF